MAIYGTALLAICYLIGLLIGRAFGLLLGVDSNVGGVGIGMIVLVYATDQLRQRGLINNPTDSGIVFWSMIYIPVVVAMAASQNVVGAISGGWLAACCGLVVVLISFALVPVINRFANLRLDESTSHSGDQE